MTANASLANPALRVTPAGAAGTAGTDDHLVIAGRSYRSRLLTGTGKFKDLEETRLATEAAAAEIVTVAIRPGPFATQSARRVAARPFHHPAKYCRLLYG